MSEPADTLSRNRVVGSMTLLGAIALLVGIVIGSLTLGLIGGPLSISPSAPSGQLLFTFGTYAGIFGVGFVYLLRYELPASYVRVSVPRWRDIGWTLVTLIVLVGLSALIPILISWLGLPFTDHSIADTIAANPAIALLFLPLSIFLVGPAEEFLYRGIIQTRLREVFDAGLAIFVASIIFAVVHFPAYLDPSNVLGTVVTVFVILLPLGAILGAVYEHTENLVVPALAHGFYNAVTYGLLYMDVVGM